MLPYWLLFLFPAVLALFEVPNSRVATLSRASLFRIPLLWWLTWLALTLFVGWRYEVGGDWFNYLKNFQLVSFDSQFAEWWLNDPGYRLIEWISMQADWGLVGVNLIAAVVFSGGLVLFCLHMPRPWLCFTIAVPYIVIVLGMGYTRQGVALGCLMAGLVALSRGRVMPFLAWTTLGTTVHKSALLLMPLAALAKSRSRLMSIALMGIVLACAYVLLLRDSVEALQRNYIDAEYQSDGALIRLVMNFIPAVLILWKRKRFSEILPNYTLWFWIAVTSVALIGLYFVSPSSTAVDRVALYVLPLQLVAFSNLPEVMHSRTDKSKDVWIFAVLAYYSAVQFVWLNYAVNSHAWIPYRWYPFEFLST